MRRLVAAVALAVLACGPGAAAEDDAIDPDRPDVSSNAKPVAKGGVQLESGLLYQRTRAAGEPTERRWSVEAMLRVGLTGDLEVRVEGEPIVRLRGEDDDTDVGDFTLSAKWRFFDPPDASPWPMLGLLPFVTVPTAPEPIGSGKTDFGALLLASFELPWRLDLDINAGVAAIGQARPGGYLLQAQTAASLAREIGGGVTGFTEVYYSSREERDDRDRVGLSVGALWKLSRAVALDAAVGTSLHGREPDLFVRAGGSVRFDR